MNKYSTTGKVVRILDAQTFASGFTKRTFVVDTAGEGAKYPNPTSFTLKNDNCGKVDGISRGDSVSIEFFIDGREWSNPESGDVRYFVDLVAVTVKCDAKAAKEVGADEAVSAWKAAHGGKFDKAAFCELCKNTNVGIASKNYSASNWQRVVDAINGTDEPEVVMADEIDDMPF